MALGDLAENHLTGLGMEAVLGVLRAAGEATRLRLLALTAESELTVTELTQILGQSQPRVSRHLKLMCEAGLLERFREGAWVFFRLAQTGPSADAAYALVDLLPRNDDVLRGDAARLESIKRARAGAAACSGSGSRTPTSRSTPSNCPAAATTSPSTRTVSAWPSRCTIAR